MQCQVICGQSNLERSAFFVAPRAASRKTRPLAPTPRSSRPSRSRLTIPWAGSLFMWGRATFALWAAPSLPVPLLYSARRKRRTRKQPGLSGLAPVSVDSRAPAPRRVAHGPLTRLVECWHNGSHCCCCDCQACCCCDTHSGSCRYCRCSRPTAHHPRHAFGRSLPLQGFQSHRHWLTAFRHPPAMRPVSSISPARYSYWRTVINRCSTQRRT